MSRKMLVANVTRRTPSSARRASGTAFRQFTTLIGPLMPCTSAAVTDYS